MTLDQVQSIIEGRRFPFPAAAVRLVETHISWVILTPEWVYKIKKPVRFSFLDFSDTDRRAFFCREEIRLNRRLAPQMYVRVLPVNLGPDGQPAIQLVEKQAIDHCVLMRRMDENRQMDLLLAKNAVSAGDVEALAGQLADFHRQHVFKKNAPYRPGDNRTDFDDLFLLKNLFEKHLGSAAATPLDGWKRLIDNFLDRHEPRLHARAEGGFWVDGHGDLHARNIFLPPDEAPVVFDCIEFNPHLRQLDVLDDLAFLCMDLEARGHPELADLFLKKYLENWRCIETAEDAAIFNYFKAYRANVRLKVTLLECEQHPSPALLASAQHYREVLEGYLNLLFFDFRLPIT